MTRNGPIPLREAVAKMNAKTPVGSVLRSKEWEAMPLALRESAQFSAGVESARVLQTVQDRMIGLLSLQQEQLASGKTATFDRSSFIDAVRQVAREEGLTPSDEAKRGGLQDITSVPRLGLIFDMQQARAQEYSRWKMDQSEGALLLYPAQEFLRIEARKAPRQDWPERWAAAGGQMFGGRMIALKSDPVWEKLSRFGTPWPPFDYASGMGLEDVSREDAIALGVLQEDEEVQPQVEEFTAKLEASAEGLSPELKDVLKSHFGDQVDIAGERVVWQSGEGTNYETKRDRDREVARSVFRGVEEALGAMGRGVPAAEADRELDAFTRYQAAAQTAAVAAGRKPVFHEDLGALAEPVASILRKVLPENTLVKAQDGHVVAWRPDVVRMGLEGILAEIKSGGGSGMLGYGSQPLHNPGNVPVYIHDSKGEIVAGFRTAKQGADLFAQARAQDFTDATGQLHHYTIGGAK